MFKCSLYDPQQICQKILLPLQDFDALSDFEYYEYYLLGPQYSCVVLSVALGAIDLGLMRLCGTIKHYLVMIGIIG